MSSNKKVNIRIPLIPGITVSDNNLLEIINHLKTYKIKAEVNLLPYHRIADHKYESYGMENKMKGKKELTQHEIQKYKHLFEDRDFKVKIGG
jgi:pyruvate formate lyase activating enzyme